MAYIQVQEANYVTGFPLVEYRRVSTLEECTGIPIHELLCRSRLTALGAEGNARGEGDVVTKCSKAYA
jgi:hypothetical protein